jgi:hypothetical protein
MSAKPQKKPKAVDPFDPDQLRVSPELMATMESAVASPRERQSGNQPSVTSRLPRQVQRDSKRWGAQQQQLSCGSRSCIGSGKRERPQLRSPTSGWLKWCDQVGEVSGCQSPGADGLDCSLPPSSQINANYPAQANLRHLQKQMIGCGYPHLSWVRLPAPHLVRTVRTYVPFSLLSLIFSQYRDTYRYPVTRIQRENSIGQG